MASFVKCQWLSWKVLFVCIALLAVSDSSKVITIAGLYPADGDWTAPLMKDISEFAKDLINNATNILPNHQIEIHWKNSQCRRKVAIDKLLLFLQDKYNVYHFVLGPACSISAEPVADIIPSYFLNMIAYSATSPGLTSSSYPNTFLGITTSYNFVVVWIKLLQFYGWRRTGIINQDTGLFNTVNGDFEEELKERNVTFDSERIGDGTLNEIDTKLDRIFQAKKYKIIFANFYEGLAYNVLCRAYLKGYIYPHVTWILPAWFTKGWTERGKESCEFCEGCDIEAALKGTLGVDSIPSPTQTFILNNDTILGLRQEEIWERFTESHGKIDASVEKFLPYAFDSMVTIAIAFNTILQNGVNLSEFNYQEKNTANGKIAESLKTSLSGVNFAGLTGQVSYDRRARKSSDCELFEYQSNGTFQLRILIPNVGLSTNIEELYVPFNEIKFTTFGRESGPLDGVELHNLPIIALAVSVLFALCALAFALFFLIINLIFHKKKVIKFSSPVLNGMILIGASLQCIVAILVLIDNRVYGRTPQDQQNGVECVECTIMCHLVWWLPALATDLIFGTLIGKSVRIYSIATLRKVHTSLKVIYIIIIIGVLMLLDTLYSVIWASIEAIRFQFIAEGPLETAYTDIRLPGSPFWYIFYCAEGGDINSGAIAVRFVYILFRWILYGIGLYFAYQIRKINIRGVNEFQSITLATLATIFFNLVRIILITMIPSVRLIDAAITLLSISYALDTILIVSFIFIPKLYYIIQDPNEKKRYTGVYNTSEIDVTTIHQLEMIKVKGELDNVKNERDTLKTTIRKMSTTADEIDPKRLSNLFDILPETNENDLDDDAFDQDANKTD